MSMKLCFDYFDYFVKWEMLSYILFSVQGIIAPRNSVYMFDLIKPYKSHNQKLFYLHRLNYGYLYQICFAT